MTAAWDPVARAVATAVLDTQQPRLQPMPLQLTVELSAQRTQVAVRGRRGTLMGVAYAGRCAVDGTGRSTSSTPTASAVADRCRAGGVGAAGLG